MTLDASILLPSTTTQPPLPTTQPAAQAFSYTTPVLPTTLFPRLHALPPVVPVVLHTMVGHTMHCTVYRTRPRALVRYRVRAAADTMDAAHRSALDNNNNIVCGGGLVKRW